MLPSPDPIRRLTELRVRLTEEERAAFMDAAAQLGVTLSTWVRRALHAALKAGR